MNKSLQCNLLLVLFLAITPFLLIAKEDTTEKLADKPLPDVVKTAPKTISDRFYYFSKGAGYTVITCGSAHALVSIANLIYWGLQWDGYATVARHFPELVPGTDEYHKKMKRAGEENIDNYKKMGASALLGLIILYSNYRFKVPQNARRNLEMAFN